MNLNRFRSLTTERGLLDICIEGYDQPGPKDNVLPDRGVEEKPMSRLRERPFKVGDHVGWNSEAGRVSGRIVRVHIKDLNYKGYTHHASKDDPQYEIKSDKTDHVALHKASVLKHLR